MSHSKRVLCLPRLLLQLIALTALLCHLSALPASAQQLWPDHTPLIDGDDGPGHNTCTPASSLYKCQFHGFLYGHWNDNGSNTPDTTHDADGITKANAVQPLCPDPVHQPNCQDSQKKIGVIMIGMSNWTKEGCGNQPPGNIQLPPQNDVNCGHGSPLPDDRKYSFIYKATSNNQVNNSRIIFVDCAEIGAIAGYWASNDTIWPQGVGKGLYANCHDIISGLGLTDAQVQVVLFKEADSGEPGAPNYPLVELPTGAGTFAACAPTAMAGQADACNLKAYMTTIARQVKQHYPNTQQMFLHSRIYAGYTIAEESPLNPEPFAYETGFAIKWLIQAQVDEINDIGILHPPILDYNLGAAPWLDWGTYMWASGTTIPCINCPRFFAPPALAPTAPLTWRDDIPTHNTPGPPQKCPPNFTNGVECDFQAFTGVPPNNTPDNTHPSLCGREKVSNLMMYFYCNSPYTIPWFTTSKSRCTNLTALNNSCTYGQGSDTQ